MITTQEHCCGADSFFDAKTADKDYRKFKKKGPSGATARITQQLSDLDVKGKSLLDIGGGIGALQWWFLEHGGDQTIDVDASSGYLAKAKKHAAEKGWEASTQFVQGDYVDAANQVGQVDFITLDKVICCYPEYEDILRLSCEKSSGYISLSYPVDGVISRAIRAVGDLFLSLKKNPFRPYIHPVKDVRDLFQQNGYERVAHGFVFPWHVETYKRANLH